MRVFVLAASLAALVACGDDGLSPRSVVGTYTLVSVGGHAVPWTSGEPGDWQTEFVSGSREFEEDGWYTYTETQRSINTSLGIDEEETSVLHGTWEIEGGVIVMEPAPGFRLRGRLAGNRLTIEQCDMAGECGVPTIATRVYVKQ